MRIIAGKHKNRIIPTSKNANYRPSTTKFREALFSILSSGVFLEKQPILGAKILDLFSGAGSLSFEALSRGAKNITLIDNNYSNLKTASNFAQYIGEENNIKTILMDATNLSKAVGQYNLVFMDPPYYNNYVIKSLNSLIENQWLEDRALIVIEIAKKEAPKLPNNLQLVKEKIYGNNKLLILKYIDNLEAVKAVEGVGAIDII